MSVQYGTHVRTILLITVNGERTTAWGRWNYPMVATWILTALDYPDHPPALPLGGDSTDCVHCGRGYSHLDRVFLMVVNQGNGLALSFDAINRHAALVRRSARLQNSDVVDRFPIPVMHLEFLPICGEARSETRVCPLQASTPGVIPR